VVRQGALALLLGVTGCGSDAPSAGMDGGRGWADGSLARLDGGFSRADGSASSSGTVVVLPDTQFYSCGYPSIFDSQTQWVVDHQRDLSIDLVVHTGDIVDADNDEQWSVAGESLHRLDGHVPYLLATGNHDLDGARRSRIGSYFTPAMFDSWPGEHGTFDATRVDNAYGVVSLGGREWLFLGLEFGPRDAVVEWARGVLAAHPTLPAALFTHAYLYADDERYDRAIQPAQPYHPDQYGVTPSEGVNDGQDLYEALVEPFENVRLVMSGHVIPDGVARSEYRRGSGTSVTEILANYQRCDRCPCEEVEGGGGFLRILTFTSTSIEVSTYSPHLDALMLDDDNRFTIEL
jgi:Calcineurin-like phosphoesterase